MYNYISVCGSLNVAIIKSLRKQKKKKKRKGNKGRKKEGGREKGGKRNEETLPMQCISQSVETTVMCR